ncbi:MAG: GNAT family N-acetyltransferase, partial [Gemmatimonadota bacterium]
ASPTAIHSIPGRAPRDDLERLFGSPGACAGCWCVYWRRSRRLAGSRILAPIDDLPVWSIVCLFVAKAARDRGVSTALLRGAVRFARAHGADLVEGDPVEPREERMPDAFACTGIASAYRRAGFEEIARRSPTRPIMRRVT